MDSGNSAGFDFLVVITAFNVEKFLPRLVDSLAGQSVPNWRAIFIDDASTDMTAESLQELLGRYGLSDRFVLVRNQKRQYKARNVYEALRRHGKPQDIVIIHDGDDHLQNDHVIERLWNEYKKGWQVVWSNWQGSDGSRGNSYHLNPWLPPRNQPWVTSHLFSFRHFLFDAIEPKDLQDESGNWLQEACDKAIAWPILEQTIKRKYVPDTLYVYNKHNPLNIFRQGTRHRNISSKTQVATAVWLRYQSKKPLKLDTRFMVLNVFELIRAAVMNLFQLKRYWQVMSDVRSFTARS